MHPWKLCTFLCGTAHTPWLLSWAGSLTLSWCQRHNAGTDGRYHLNHSLYDNPKKSNLDTISYCNTLKSPGRGVSSLCGAVSKDKFPPLHNLFSQGISDTLSGQFPHDNCCSISFCWDQWAQNKRKCCYSLKRLIKALLSNKTKFFSTFLKTSNFQKQKKKYNHSNTILHISLRKSSK